MPGGGNLVRSQKYRKKERTPRSAHARYYYCRSLADPPGREKISPPARCQSAPRVMDSHSRSASPREPARPQHRPPSPPTPPSPPSLPSPPSPPSPGAFVNHGFQHDDPNHNDSFASNQTHHNTHTKEKNGDTKTLEAVNLELINLQPKNGNAKKKDVEVDMNASNPYDEYFVPVNEHRKYMRGEKLYVTADKRGEKGGCRRPLCWALLALGAAAGVALAALAATGVLFDNSPTPVEQYNASISSARALGGIGHVHHEHSHDNDHDRAHLPDQQNNDQTELTTTTQQGTDALNDEEIVHSEDSQETGDASMYVPRTVEGELKIDNEEFTAALADPDSDEYKTFTESFNNALKEALFPKGSADSRDNELFVEVVQLRKGSVIVTYRIHWKPKLNANPTDIITPNELKANLDNYLSKNNRMLSIHHVAEDKIETRLVLNLCQMNKNNCDYGCEFDESTLEFTCTCPKGQMLDINSPRICVSLFEPNLTEEIKKKLFNVTDSESIPRTSTMKPISKDELNTESVNRYSDQNIFDWKETNHLIPETTTETDPDLKFSHIFGHQSNENENPLTGKPESSTKTAHLMAVTEIISEPSSEPESAPISKPASASNPSSKLESHSEPEPSSKPEPALEPEPASEPEPSPKPVSVSEPEVSSVPEPDLLQELSHKPEPSTESEPNNEPEPVSKSEFSLKLELIPEPELKTASASEPVPTTEFNHLSESENSTFRLKSTNERKAAPEPTIIPEQPAESSSERTTEREPERQQMPVPEPAFESEIVADPSIKSDYETEPVQNPILKAESALEQNPELKSEVGKNIKSTRAFILLSETRTTTEVLPKETPDTEKILDSETQAKSEVESKTELAGSKQVTSVSKYTTKPDQGTESSLFYFHGTKPREISLSHEKNEKHSTHKESIEKRTTIVAPKLSASEKKELPVDSGLVDENNDSTTTRVSISEFHIINEPSYEASPEILSILRETNRKINESSHTDATTDENKYYSDSDWLEDDKQLKALTNDKPSDSDSDLMHITKVRYFSDLTDVITDKPNNTEYDIPFDKVTETNEVSMLDIENTKKEEPTTALMGLLYIKNDNTTTSLLVNTFHGEKKKLTELNGTVSDHVNDTSNINEDSIPTILDPLLEVNDTYQTHSGTTMPNSNYIEQSTENTVDTMEEKYLIEALSNHPNNDTQSAKEEQPGENMDITFDTINMLFNRSSKLIQKYNHTNNEIVTTDTNVFLKESTTTDSDWLSESATEINYEEIISKITRDRTTESNINKIDMIIRETSKDDFEPDYLNNMGVSNNKMNERDDIGVYGMAHDYDNEESRVKRVNAELKTSKLLSTTEGSNFADSLDTTTVSEYIYKVSENTSNQSSESDHNSKEIIPTNMFEPAPVWETSDSDKYIDPTITKGSITNTSEESKNRSQNITLVNNVNVTIYEISALNQNNTISVTKHINSQSAEYDDHETEMNPFLPEIENNKNLVKKLQEGHDLEPTNLNETQNENVDDHQITTEKQQQVQRNHTPTELSIISRSNSFNTTETDTILDDILMNIPSDSHELSSEIMNSVKKNDSSTYKIIIDTLKDKNEEENLPISTFLMDTDDLDREHTTERRPTVIKNSSLNESSYPPTSVPEKITMSTKTTDGSNDYLGVVPIMQDKVEDKEVLKKNYKSKNILELNDISDSPKKSARRTFDLTL